MNLSQLKTFLGWCAVINMALLLFNTLMYFLLKDFITDVWSMIFSSTEEQFDQMYIIAVAVWKILIFTFFIVPYFALGIMKK